MKIWVSKLSVFISHLRNYIYIYIYYIYYIYIYYKYIYHATTNNDNSINDNNKKNNYSDNKNNDCFYYNSINVNNDRKKVMLKIKIEIAINFLLPKFLPKSK